MPNATDWRQFIRTQITDESRPQPQRVIGGTKITGPELTAVWPVIDKLDDDIMKNKLKGMFNAFPKYQVLGIIISEDSEFFKANSSEVLEIVEAAAMDDYNKRLALDRFPKFAEGD